MPVFQAVNKSLRINAVSTPYTPPGGAQNSVILPRDSSLSRMSGPRKMNRTEGLGVHNGPNSQRFMAGAGCAAHIQFENTRHHDDRLWPFAILKHRKFQRLSTINEKASAKALLISNNPIAAVVLPDQKLREFRITRGRFAFVHDISPLLVTYLLSQAYEFETGPDATS